jgi:hypothetical protein
MATPAQSYGVSQAICPAIFLEFNVVQRQLLA